MLNETLISLKDAAALLGTSPAALAQRAWRARHAGTDSLLGLHLLQPAGPRTRRYLRRVDLHRFLDTLTDPRDTTDEPADIDYCPTHGTYAAEATTGWACPDCPRDEFEPCACGGAWEDEPQGPPAPKPVDVCAFCTQETPGREHYCKVTGGYL